MGDAARDWGTLRPGEQGVHPGHGEGGVRRAAKPSAKRDFTVGIVDDLTHLSLEWDSSFRTEASRAAQGAVFYGLGSDGTVSANKNSIKIIGEATELYAQGYFVYDSKKSGAVTVSHLRFGPAPIRSAYLIGDNEASSLPATRPCFWTLRHAVACFPRRRYSCSTPWPRRIRRG